MAKEIFVSDEDILACWPSEYMEKFAQILNGEVDLDVAKTELLSLIGSRFDPRVENLQSLEMNMFGDVSEGDVSGHILIGGMDGFGYEELRSLDD